MNVLFKIQEQIKLSTLVKQTMISSITAPVNTNMITVNSLPTMSSADTFENRLDPDQGP